MMAVGAASVLAFTPTSGAPGSASPPAEVHIPEPGPDLLAASRDLFSRYRRIGRLAPPATPLPVFADWMTEEAGDDTAAPDWTDHAVRPRGGDRGLASYALTRRALISYYGANAAETASLASGASSDRVRGRFAYPGMADARRILCETHSVLIEGQPDRGRAGQRR